MDPPAAIPAESTAGTATESHLTEPGRLKSGVQVAHNLPCRLLRSSGHGQGIMPFAINSAVLGLKRSEAKSMRTLVLSTAVIAGVVWIGIAPANAAPPSMSGISNTKIEVGTVKNVGYWRRYYRRYGYPVPYAYYPPANGYDVPPAAYSYPPATSYAPPPGDDYVDAPPSEGDYNDEGNYGNGQPQEGDYAGAPPPEGY